ncbi:hypothetical protein WJ437_08365 [Ignavigranum ruoffiae]|uniref:hypothetical protein n=1 Tax=Ignavigranum ruoffiae TaxID=89093 RepID=UPI0023548EAB|nr:hypothetical protein [Ignavigranum ruoffiae]
MKRKNLYIHYDSVTNHVMTRGINFVANDFLDRYFPDNMILAEAPQDYGRYDSLTNFKILRGKIEIQDYLSSVVKAGLRISNWIDFESVEAMHQLAPSEIAEILYLFHANKSLRSAFFYKLQNNYVYLTLSNGLNKVYYRYVSHFYPRFQRAMKEQMVELINEGNPLAFLRKTHVQSMVEDRVEEIAPIFATGLKVNFNQAYQKGTRWYVPLNIIEDQLTLLSRDQRPSDHIGFIIYDTNGEQWDVELKLSDTD